jgi:hypothetical protein
VGLTHHEGTALPALTARVINSGRSRYFERWGTCAIAAPSTHIIIDDGDDGDADVEGAVVGGAA